MRISKFMKLRWRKRMSIEALKYFRFLFFDVIIITTIIYLFSISMIAVL